MKKYSEQIVRYPALDDEGRPREILERITFERDQASDGTMTEPVVINRRFDVQTGETLTRLGDDEFQENESGIKLHLQR